MLEFEMTPLKSVTNKLNLNKMVEVNNQTAKQILNSLDSKRSLNTRVSTPKQTNRYHPENADTTPFIPIAKHTYSSKLLRYTSEGV